MNNLNSVLLEGNLVRDAQIRTTSNGKQVCTFTLATNRYFKQGDSFEQEVSFVDVSCWGKLADSVYAKGKKGFGVRVIGRLKQSRWVDEGGKNRSKIIIIAEHVEFRPKDKKKTEDEPIDEPIEESSGALEEFSAVLSDDDEPAEEE